MRIKRESVKRNGQVSADIKTEEGGGESAAKGKRRAGKGEDGETTDAEPVQGGRRAPSVKLDAERRSRRPRLMPKGSLGRN